MIKSSQLHLLEHFANHRPHLFHQRVRVNHEISDDILDHISDHPIFSSGGSQNCQLPIAIQLAIFLNHAGHYGNVIFSVGSVINCTNRVMVAILDQHDTFIQFPGLDSEDVARAQVYMQNHSCPEWGHGILAADADGSPFCLFAKPAMHSETFFDHKSNYSLNCQASIY
ncbi:hypothetical protein PAXRUDRAFT_160478 [Paxillus rubicundulus Ve08.2h10]|uniref:Uncharacterized protein n=1 Tax=Paxillus rubicundulus Ve08.2h10 TaxID=930991 RepID=A0A0D0DMM7_9AGAM|nr:hypothetical protein PAXRUDRAFT_160478 [Paxillus rubicundulus Ve08.2h10]